MKKQADLTFTIEVFREGKNYIAYNPEFDVSSCGSAPKHARENLKDALRGFMKSAAKMGTLEVLLEEAGFVKKGDMWIDRFSLAV
ncbi:MAG: type II toxin-antitoxin system HicB family antitoxin [bacterium]|nr:type II toxin-antitoxin system HicB family antitoxin [bacterium]